MKVFRSLLSIFISSTVLTAGAFVVSAEEDSSISNNDIPEYVLEKVREKVEEVTYEPKKTGTYKVLPNGEEVKVPDIPDHLKIMKRDDGSFSTQSVPDDGYVYVYDHYDWDATQKDWYFESTGTIRYTNNLNTTAEVYYEQQTTKEVDWDVGVDIGGSTSIGNDFLGSIEVNANLSVNRSKNFLEGRKYGAKVSIPGNTVAYITNYAVGANTDGAIVYRKYSPSGTSWLGMYKDYQGGTAVIETDAHVEITDSEPIS
ncbi:hypothetical protein EDD68_1286 [Melghiribacillus thermohalophilus]|uniref:Uncharacterized protein n=1 Tax=Melghiribacillus thermohalophilus TaxID=1324956 RepID=A0A4R3MUC1_9BACI|nr:hypothetical protein [Melghiribacillus thermohalophilus]TCT17558.1 hypothetical protein EDD68_1286 [Melghiribacillus thermohalophilus]